MQGGSEVWGHDDERRDTASTDMIKSYSISSHCCKSRNFSCDTGRNCVALIHRRYQRYKYMCCNCHKQLFHLQSEASRTFAMTFLRCSFFFASCLYLSGGGVRYL